MAQHLQGQARDEAVAAVFEALRAGVFGETEVVRYPLADASRAHEDIAERRRCGTAILIP